MITVAVTGISGKSGQYFLKRLMKEKEHLSSFHFLLLCRQRTADSVNTEGYRLIEEAKSVGLHLSVVEVNLSDERETEAFFSTNKVDLLLHIAGVLLSRQVVLPAMKCGVNNFILVHTTGIYSKYKAAGEEYRRIEDEIYSLAATYRQQGREVAVTILRPTMIYGDLNDKNVSTFIKMVDKLRLFPVINGAHYALQPVWCGDLGNAYFEVLTHFNVTKNKEYILSGGAPIELREMFCVIADKLKKKIYFVSCPYPIAYIGAWVVYALSLKKVDFREKVQRMVEPRDFTHQSATDDFGYTPVDFATGVSEEIMMYKDSKKV